MRCGKHYSNSMYAASQVAPFEFEPNKRTMITQGVTAHEPRSFQQHCTNATTNSIDKAEIPLMLYAITETADSRENMCILMTSGQNLTSLDEEVLLCHLGVQCHLGLSIEHHILQMTSARGHISSLQNPNPRPPSRTETNKPEARPWRRWPGAGWRRARIP